MLFTIAVLDCRAGRFGKSGVRFRDVFGLRNRRFHNQIDKIEQRINGASRSSRKSIWPGGGLRYCQ